MNSKKWDTSLIFDTHVHLFDERFQQPGVPDWRTLVKQAMASGVGYFLNVGINLPTSQKALVQAREFPNIWTAAGVHPNYINELNEQTKLELEELVKDPKIIAIGEIGLDYFREFTSKKNQQEGLHFQLQLAVKNQLPVLLHIRDAYNDTYKIVSQYPVKGIVHCFSGTLEDAQKFIKLGFLISFSGTITFSNAQTLQKIVQQIPLEKIVVETDAPYLSPHPNRGKVNSPEYINLTSQKISDLKNINEENIKATIAVSTFKILNLV